MMCPLFSGAGLLDCGHATGVMRSAVSTPWIETAAILKKRHPASPVIMAIRVHHCSNPPFDTRSAIGEVAFSRSPRAAAGARLARWPGLWVRAVRTTECPAEYTVLMVVAGRPAAVGRHHRAQSWGVPGARGRGSAGHAGRRPRSGPYRQESTTSLRVRFWRPQQDSNLRTRLRSAFLCIAATSGTLPGMPPWGAYGTREIRRPQLRHLPP
jgi:hypothetical protein